MVREMENTECLVRGSHSQFQIFIYFLNEIRNKIGVLGAQIKSEEDLK